MAKLVCNVCGREFVARSRTKSKPMCRACQKAYRDSLSGRAGAELDRINMERIERQVKVFTREEIDAVAHLYTPPVKQKGTVCMESKPLPDFGDEYGRN